MSEVKHMTPEEIEAMRADMAAGTQGPWRCYMTTNGGKLIGIGDAEGGGVADCGFGLWRDGKERAANARRIANVPLMEAYILAQAEESDGRPCSMDVFAAQLFSDCDDKHDRSDAINHWLYGSWDEALAYLTPTGRAAIAKAMGTTP